MNIRVDLNYPIKDGAEVKFRSPVDCSQVTGLIVYYFSEDGVRESKEFAFADAHGNNVGDIDHLFAENVVVKVILDVAMGMAYVQNADTNAYLEGRFDEVSVDDSKASNKPWSSKNTVDKLCPSFTESGAAVICNPVEGYPLNIVSHINATQSGTGDPSPDNIRPITGYNAVNVWRGGRNLIDDVAFYQSKGFELQADGYWKFNATNGILYENTAGLQGQFTVSLYGYFENASYNGVVIYILYADGTAEYHSKRDSNNFLSYTTNASKVVSTIKLTRNSGTTEYYSYIKDLQIEYGATAHAYEPYRGETFTIDLGQTVYGGYVALNSGELTIDHALLNIDPEEVYLDDAGIVTTTVESQNGLPMDITYRGLCNRLTSINAGGGDIFTWGGPYTDELENKYGVIYKVSDEVFTPDRIPELYGAIATYQPEPSFNADGTESWPPTEEYILTADNLIHTESGTADQYGDVQGGHIYFGLGNCEIYFVYDDTLAIGPFEILSKGIWVFSSIGAYVANLKYGASIGYELKDDGTIQFRLPDVTNETEARTWVTENPLQVYYKLAEPVTMQLTPQEILALAGTNIIYSSTGNTDVSGKADPNVIIQDLYNKINALSATLTALVEG